MNREEKIQTMRYISKAYRLLMGEIVEINQVRHVIRPVPRNSEQSVCDLCDYQGHCPYVVSKVCVHLVPTENTNFTLTRFPRTYEETPKTDTL